MRVEGVCRGIRFVPGRAVEVNCPVDGCNGMHSTPSSMQWHFRNTHIEHNDFIPEQGVVPQCRLCKFFEKTVGLEGHRNTEWCIRERKRYRNYQLFREEQKSRTVKICVNGEEIRRVDNFDNLGRIVSKKGDDSKVIEANLKKARRKWAMFKRLLTREDTSWRVMEYFYKAIVQSILLYAAETWVISETTLRKFRTFHVVCSFSDETVH